MGKISVLPFAVANLIAAGEVVDRPASVIKELMENAIDAGSTRITVEIQNGGVTFMRVSDNGCGMSAEDLPVAIRRHATSKIKTAEDLDGILTLGFRGEALAAIASVSDLRIISKTADAEFGAVLEAHGGEIAGIYEQGCSTGTSVIIENLFANVPARRKFLKKDVTESMAVTANVERVALSHPEIAFRLIVDGNTRIETAGDGNLQNAVYAVFGRDLASRLIPVESDNDGIGVHGFIGRSDNMKATRNYQTVFINGRYVKSKTVSAAIEQAYTSYMASDKFPVCILFLTLSPARVDVNVHPAKLEVKFSNEKPVFEAVYYTIRSALENNCTRPSIELQLGGKAKKRSPFEGRMSDSVLPVKDGKLEGLRTRQMIYDLDGDGQPQPQARMTAEEYRALYGGSETTRQAKPETGKMPSLPQEQILKKESAAPQVTSSVAGNREMPVQETPKQETPKQETAKQETVGLNVSEPSACPPEPKPAQEPEPPKADAVQTAPVSADVQNADPTPNSHAYWRIVGEVFHAYVLVETEDKMLIIDKHAAHERILFEQLKAGLQEAQTVSQLLMLPIDVMMTAAEVEALKEYNGELEKIGFSLRYARNTVSADAIPEGVESQAVSDMLEAIAGRILNATGNVKLTRDIIFEKALYQAACKAAIKAGRAYADGHIEWLVQKLRDIPDITVCPHGRPVAMELSHRTLDKQFDRMGF